MAHHLELKNGLLEPSSEAQPPEGLYTSKELIRDRREVSVRVLNTTRRDQKLKKLFPMAHCEPDTLVTPGR
jgi:hypothetical protein